MKKTLLIVAVILASNLLFSQTYSFIGLTTDDVTNLSSNGTLVQTSGTAAPFSINYTSPDYMTLTVKGVNLRYKNSSNKSNIIKVDQGYLQFDGKNFEILFSGLTVGQKIKLNVSAKSTSNTVFSLTGATIDSPVEAITTGITNVAYVDVIMTITASDVIIKETANGGRFKSIEIANMFTSVGSINANKTVISEKYFDILGREISNKSKGLIIKRQTYDDQTTSTFKTYIKSEKNK